jgi:uncharacterized coiled-coil DUF342 family protein
VEELDRAIKDLERTMERGDLSLVDEKKAISEISKLSTDCPARLTGLLI